MAELAGGIREVELAVGDYRELTLALCEQWPQMAALIERSAVAIDGQIYQDAFAEALASGSEVFFMPRIEGG
jgi:molybdopterin converting factor small subunit